MAWKDKVKPLLIAASVFALLYFLPLEAARFRGALLEALYLARWYAREHVLLCLIPAFFIAGAIAVFVGQGSVMKYLGPQASKPLAYGVASVSGTILAVCSCTVLPLFAGIYRMGAGLGPATAFLYSGPAINVLAIILTARVLGSQLGIARAVGAVTFSVLIGVAMHLLFRREELEKIQAQPAWGQEQPQRPLWQTALYFALMVGILVFANWGAPPPDSTGLWASIYRFKWPLVSMLAVGLGGIMVAWFGLKPWLVAMAAVPAAAAALLMPAHPQVAFVLGVAGLSALIGRRTDEAGQWFEQTWFFARQMLPLLLWGVLAAGLALGRPGHEGLIPMEWIERWVGGNSLGANFFASFAGAFMYFATLTEVPILQGLLGSGMGQGPALALLLAGPALSLPNMLVIRSVLGTRKTVAFVTLVIVMATIAGKLYGALWG